MVEEINPFQMISRHLDDATAVAVNTAGIKKVMPVIKKAKIWDTSDDSSSSEDEATTAKAKSKVAVTTVERRGSRLQQEWQIVRILLMTSLLVRMKQRRQKTRASLQ